MPSPNPTYYDILSLSPTTLSQTDPATTSALIKRAYRRALLNHHPDKRKPTTHPPTQPHQQPQQQPQQPPNHSSSPASAYTIDQISAAYATLSLPSLRQAYDRSLLLLSSQSQPQQGRRRGEGTEFQTGIETIDLDDLDCEDYDQEDDDDEGRGTGTRTRWYRACRCGNPRGYLFTEDDLEDAADLGELMVGCADCSLWLRVHFAVVDDEDDGEEGGGSGTEGALGVSAGAGAGKR